MKRATTKIQKREVIERLLDVWLSVPELRLGQLIDTGVPCGDKRDLFYIEDYDLLHEIEDTFNIIP